MYRLNRERPRVGLPVLLFALGGVACADTRARFVYDEVTAWRVEPEIRIGSLDDSDYAFSSVSAIEVGTDGTIYSVHRQETAIRRWTPDGQPAGTVGRSGEGPGEFTQPGPIGWRGDSLWVLDYGKYRFSFFTADGRFLSHVAPRVDLGTAEQAAEAIYPPRPSALLADGSVYGVTPAFSHEVVAGRLTEIAHVRMGTTDGVTDTITVLPTGPESVLGVLRDGGGGTFGPQPFGDAVIGQLSHDGAGLFVLERPAVQDAADAEFRLTRLDLSGDTVFTRTYPYQPTRLPREKVDSAIEARAESFHEFVGQRTGTTLAQWEQWVADAMYAPSHYPPVGQVLAGRDGTVWLALTPERSDGREWLVLNAEGDPLAKIVTPEETRVLLADRRNVWGVEHDSLEVPYIVRYAVAAP